MRAITVALALLGAAATVLACGCEDGNDAPATTTAEPKPSPSPKPDKPADAVVVECNGSSALCERKYSDVSHVATHNSPFIGTGPADNQHVGVREQLDLGVRFMTAPAHDQDGEIRLCHADCAIKDGGSLAEYLKTVAGWMNDDKHRHEVLTLLLTNSDAIDPTKFAKHFQDAGLDRMAFQPEKKLALDEWPTLGKMVNSSERLVVFMDYHADIGKVPYILPEFDYIWETPFGETDANFPTCDVDRPSGADTSKMMGLVNHVLNTQLLPNLGGLFGGDEGLQVPAQGEAERTNSKESLMKQANLCIDKHRRTPNVVLVDFVEQGKTMEVQKILNGP